MKKPFSSYLLFQNEFRCKIFHMKMSLICIKMNLYGFTRRLVLTQRELGNGLLISNAFRHGSVNYSAGEVLKTNGQLKDCTLKHVPRHGCGHVCFKTYINPNKLDISCQIVSNARPRQFPCSPLKWPNKIPVCIRFCKYQKTNTMSLDRHVLLGKFLIYLRRQWLN